MFQQAENQYVHILLDEDRSYVQSVYLFTFNPTPSQSPTADPHVALSAAFGEWYWGPGGENRYDEPDAGMLAKYGISDLVRLSGVDYDVEGVDGSDWAKYRPNYFNPRIEGAE